MKSARSVATDNCDRLRKVGYTLGTLLVPNIVDAHEGKGKVGEAFVKDVIVPEETFVVETVVKPLFDKIWEPFDKIRKGETKSRINPTSDYEDDWDATFGPKKQ